MLRPLSALASRRAHAWLAIALLVVGCRNRGTDGPGTEQTQLQAEATIRRAIRQSPEGFIFLPSKKAERVYELPRLNEIAQSMRQPAAACFLGEAVKTMRIAPEGGGEEGVAFEGVPDGQAKLRMRVGADGKVLRVETLETGFDGESVPECISEELSRRRFPDNQSGTAHYIDVVYWVSLGPQPRTDDHAARVRREQVEAGVRAKKCLQGRVGVGAYAIDGLNLIASNGATVANRVEQKGLPDDVRQCVATAFRSLRLLADDDTFIRPVNVHTEFLVGDDGVVTVEDEDWLRLVELEERARRDAMRAEREAVNPVDTLPPEPVPAAEVAPELPEAEAAEAEPLEDPGKGGLRLNIGPRGGSRP